MTKDEYIEYFRRGLSEDYPDLVVTVYRGQIKTEGRGETRIGYPIPCDCGSADCLGWVMAQVKTERIGGKLGVRYRWKLRHYQGDA